MHECEISVNESDQFCDGCCSLFYLKTDLSHVVFYMRHCLSIKQVEDGVKDKF